jgi:ketosteroid isomerase-like protein
MIRAVSSALIVLALGAAALSASRSAPGGRQGADGSAEEAVRRLSAEEVQAFLKRDSKALANLWSDDFVVTNPLNQFVTKQQVLKMVDSGVLIITSFDRQIDYLKVYGDTVILAGRETVVWGGKMPNAGRTEQLRFTALWMKKQDRWQQVARHANIVSERQSLPPERHARGMRGKALCEPFGGASIQVGNVDRV